ncbi:hypothetical protein CDL12_03791 [Handroanthus impetiginosus]|uniref:Protein LNK2 n=1 Tax=Handroanthus impetiginosus TaxID=429701 RepID=A0A2G9I147_9LAMI|nr:hypothetical protein CDL12_03791 [Handroanthus impetiginosus]
MFDWNDEELTNIIWDEAGEKDGYIGPYRDQIEDKPPSLFGDPTEEERNQDTANVSPVGQKKPSTKSEHGVELDSNSKYDYDEHAMGLGPDSWPDELNPSLSSAAKADPNSTGTAVLKNSTTSSKNGSLRSAAEAIQLDKDTELFQNPPEDTANGDFVDYDWANIGSFDDLDRICCNNDPIFGDISVRNADELWSCSKDVTSSPPGPVSLCGDSSDLAIGPLRTLSDKLEFEAHYMLDPSQALVSECEKPNEITPDDVQTFAMGGKIQACHKQLDEGTAAAVNEFPDELFSCVQGNKNKILLKGQKSDKNNEPRQLHDLCSTWSLSGNPFQQVNTEHARSFVNPSPPSASLQENHFSGPLLTSPMYRNPELASSGYEVPLGKVNSLKMTPEEKIEKLRRRQQMRAILAIQKQHQHFSNQVAVAKHSTMEEGTIEVDNSLNTNSSGDYDDFNTISMFFDSCSVEEAVLYQLKDTIAKLELQIRLWIRDSLFRLAKGAMQRQYTSDTHSTNTSSRGEVFGNEDLCSHDRFTRMPDVEAETNPIDRTVAHLLFYRPLEFSGKPAEMPESPISANISYEREADSLKSLVQDFFPDSFEHTQMTSPRGSKAPGLYSEGNQSKESPCLDASENASNKEAADEGMAKIEASK